MWFVSGKFQMFGDTEFFLKKTSNLLDKLWEFKAQMILIFEFNPLDFKQYFKNPNFF